MDLLLLFLACISVFLGGSISAAAVGFVNIAQGMDVAAAGPGGRGEKILRNCRFLFKNVARVGRRAAIADASGAGGHSWLEYPRRGARLGDSAMSKPKYFIPQPDRVRKIEKSFAWIDHRLLRHGYLAAMTHQDQSLYLFLALAADRHGVSFYRKEKICDILGLDFQAFEVARDRLTDLKRLAFEPYSAATPNGFYQVLPADGRPGQGDDAVDQSQQVADLSQRLAKLFTPNDV